ncbi:MAG TPA: cytochrome P450 [Candidatus Limnocylindrales bacterium]|nr:cytochrome P450 [Candidatus Limnocylindrales bacterium]
MRAATIATLTPPQTAPATLPRALPLLGHALRFKRQPLEFLESLRPLGDVVAIRLGPKPAYVVNSPELVRRMLVAEAQAFEAGLLLEKVKPFVGNGLIALRGTDHTRHRRLLQPAFHHSSIARYVEVMRQLAAERVCSWREGQQVVADVEMMELATAVVGKTLFSMDLDRDVVDEVVGSMPMLLEGIRKRLMAPTELLEKLPTPSNRRFNTAIRRIHQVVEDVIAEYRRTGIDHGDLASMMLSARDEHSGQGFSDVQVRDEALTMLAAGTQTTATTIAWALHILSTHDEIQQRAHAQIHQVLGDRNLTFDDIERLDYIRRLLTETLRLYPPAWLLSRRAVSEVTLGDHILPRGASILFSPYALHRDPKTYPDPDVFDPDRWIPERAKSIPRPAFIPFGAGNRQCLGEGFAWVEATVVLTVILQQWRVRLVPGQIIRKVALATLVPSRLPLLLQRP